MRSTHTHSKKNQSLTKNQRIVLDLLQNSGVILDSTAKNEYHENYLKAKSLLDLLK